MNFFYWVLLFPWARNFTPIASAIQLLNWIECLQGTALHSWCCHPCRKINLKTLLRITSHDALRLQIWYLWLKNWYTLTEQSNTLIKQSVIYYSYVKILWYLVILQYHFHDISYCKIFNTAQPHAWYWSEFSTYS